MRTRSSTATDGTFLSRWVDGLDFADVVLLAVPFLAIFPLRNNDLWWHLASGRAMVERGTFLHGDPFSFTGFMGDWIDNQWLSQLAFYATWWLGGNLGLIVLRTVLYTAVFFLIRSLVRAGRQPSSLLPCLVVGVALSYGWWEVRPSVFSILGTLLLLRILEEVRRSGRGFAALPVLFVVWASAHPGFLFGLCILAGTVAALYVEPFLSGWPRWTGDSRTARRLCVWTGVSFLATLANPYGWRVYSEQVSIAHNAAFRAVLDEWQPPSETFSVFVLLTLGGFIVARYRRVAPAAWIPILGAAVLATTGVRFQEYFALVAVPAVIVNLGPPRPTSLRTAFVLALLAGSILVGLRTPLSVAMPEGRALDAVDRRLAVRIQHNALFLSMVLTVGLTAAAGRGRNGHRWLLVHCRGRARLVSVAAALFLAAVLAWWAPRAGLLPSGYVEPDRYPGRCLSSLHGENPRVFNRLSWGGWLIWTLRLPTFIDGRGWGQPLFLEYQQSHGPGWRAVFDAHRIGLAIVPKGDVIATELSRAPDWQLTCDDAVAVVYRRRNE